MVGPGTGIAPMRALLQEREKRGKAGKAGSNTLFFGCRKPTEDYIYRDELEAYETSGTLSKLHLAFRCGRMCASASARCAP
jgi:NADPH-ferrihemoprotein reductase